MPGSAAYPGRNTDDVTGEIATIVGVRAPITACNRRPVRLLGDRALPHRATRTRCGGRWLPSLDVRAVPALVRVAQAKLANLLAAPGPQASGEPDHCGLLRDRFAILDPPDREDIDGIGSFRQVLDTQYAAVDYPWCVTVDPSTSQNVHVPRATDAQIARRPGRAAHRLVTHAAPDLGKVNLGSP
jgi:hypothetical protein